MKKIFEFFKSPLFIPIATLLILYVYWLIYIPSKTFFSNWDLRLGIICLTIYFIILVFGKIFINNRRLHFLPYIIAIPISLVGIYFGSLYFFLMFIFEFYRERPVFLFLLGLILVAVISYKKLKKHDKQLSIFFLTTFPIFALAIFNFIIYCPKVWAMKEFAGYKYYVIEEIWDYPHSDNNFYKCKQLSFHCELLDGTNYGNPEIIIDEQKREVSLADFRGLRYTDGFNPRSYDLAGVEYDDHIYYLTKKCNNFNYNGQNECETQAFIPYQCNLDNLSCNSLPIKVEGDFGYGFYWEVDETNNELKLLYEDELLVFMYDKQFQCFIDECEVLK